MVTEIFTLAAFCVALIVCNQTLAIMLTNQLCRDLREDAETFALDLENTAVIITPLIPWCIAAAVPLATVGAPTAGIFFACYLSISLTFVGITKKYKE